MTAITPPTGTGGMTAPPIEQLAPHVRTRVQGNDLRKDQFVLLGAGIGLLALGCIWGIAGGGPRFYFAYLTGYMGVLGLCLGGLFFTLLQHITRAGWSVGVRRLAEHLCGALPVLLLLYFPIWIGFDDLYGHWVDAEITDPLAADYDPVLANKAVWLNKPFFIVRVFVYFAIWIGLATFFRRLSARQDETGDPQISLRLSRVAAPGILLFALSITFAAFDWIMSLDPHWFSTIFGVCYFAGGFMAFLAFVILLALWIGRRGYLKEVVNTEHYHDLGKLMFAFMVFWTYVNFSQYMLIWYANLPEETQWFAERRAEGGWGAVGTLLIFGHFFVPFAFLMSRHVKRNTRLLAIGAGFMLAIHWVDMQYLIVPNAGHGPGHGAGHGEAGHAAAGHGPEALTEGGGLFGHFWHNLGVWLHGITVPDVLCYAGMLALLAGLTILQVRRHNLVPTRDPRLLETLHFQNQ